MCLSRANPPNRFNVVEAGGGMDSSRARAPHRTRARDSRECAIGTGKHAGDTVGRPRLQRLVHKHRAALRVGAKHSPLRISSSRALASSASAVSAGSVEEKTAPTADNGAGVPRDELHAWERCIVQVPSKPLALRMLLERRGLCDGDIPAVIAALRMRIRYVKRANTPWPEGRCINLFVAAGGNQLSDNGVTELVAALTSMRATVQVRVLRLHMNRFGDGAAEAIASLVSVGKVAMSELHVSHNSLTEAGISTIARALARRHGVSRQRSKQGTRARAAGAQSAPLWLRAEYNLVDVSAVTAILRSIGVSTCQAADKEKCGVGMCGLSPSADLHVYLLGRQRRRLGQVLRGMLVDERKAVRVLSPRRVRFSTEARAAGKHRGGEALGGDVTCRTAFPMFVVLDESALLGLCADMPASPLSMATLISHSQSLATTVVFVLLETALRQLDRMKRERRPPAGVEEFFAGEWQQRLEDVCSGGVVVPAEAHTTRPVFGRLAS